MQTSRKRFICCTTIVIIAIHSKKSYFKGNLSPCDTETALAEQSCGVTAVMLFSALNPSARVLTYILLVTNLKINQFLCLQRSG